MRFAFYTAVALAATIASFSEAINLAEPKKQVDLKPEVMSQFVMEKPDGTFGQAMLPERIANQVKHASDVLNSPLVPPIPMIPGLPPVDPLVLMANSPGCMACG